MPRIHATKQTLYLDKTFGQEDELLKKLKAESLKEGVLKMQVSAHEAQILQTLASMIQAEKIVEIGSLYCYSTVYLARGLKEGGKIFTCDIAQHRHDISRSIIKNYPEFNKIEWVTGPSSETLPKVQEHALFDLVFIDADKESYGLYLEWAEKHLRPGGLLVADNSFLFGSVYGEPERDNISEKTTNIMIQFNQKLAESPLWISALIPTKEGLTIAIKQ